jgi:hypothetical protein
MIENFTVRQRRHQRVQSGRAREAPSTDLGLSAAIISVAGLALFGEEVSACRDSRRIGAFAQWADHCLGGRWNAVPQKIGCDFDFQFRRLLPRRGQAR